MKTRPTTIAPLSRFSLRMPRSFEPRRSGLARLGRARLYCSGLVLALAIYLGTEGLWHWKHIVSSSGGRYFVHRVEIAVPAFQQNDPRWGFDLLGNTIDTLGQSGCAVASAAMVLRSYGVDTDPQRLNGYLTTHGGYVDDGLLVWEKAAEVAPGDVQKAYEDLPTYALLDGNLLHGNPVIVRLRLGNGHTHFVVVVGKQGWDYLVRDPARPPDWGVYPLKDLTGEIRGLRFYRFVPAAARPPNSLVQPPALASSMTKAASPAPDTSVLTSPRPPAAIIAGPAQPATTP